MSEEYEILLEPESHTYLLDAHTIIPGVTDVLSDLTSFGRAKAQDVEFARDRGTAVHEATAFYDRRELDADSVGDVIRTRFDAYCKFREVTGFEPVEVEKTCYHDQYGYATTLDRVGRLYGRLSVLELKATAAHSAVTGLQTAAQFEAYNHECRRDKKPLAEKRYSVRLLDSGEFDLQPYENKRDFKVFLSCLIRYNWRLEHERAFRKIVYQNIIDPIFVTNNNPASHSVRA